MRERDVIHQIAQRVPAVGDDCAVIPFGHTKLVFTTDMLWRKTDLPEGVSPHAIGWRAVAVSLSDIAAMGARPLGVVLALGAPKFEWPLLEELLQGILDCCTAARTAYLGGDLSRHDELTLVSSALGETERPVMRHGARAGELVCITGALGRTAVAMRRFERGERERANELFEFTPRIDEGLALAPYATSMIDVSDGLARSLYQLSEASGVGFRISYDDVPVVADVNELASDEERCEMALYAGEDFELLFTLPRDRLPQAQQVARFTVIGSVISERIVVEEDGKAQELADRGYEH